MKLASILFLLVLGACSMGVLKEGGERVYSYDVFSEHSSEDLMLKAPLVVTTSQRDPIRGKLDDLFSKKQPPLKRIGIMVFETVLQPTRSGLTNFDQIYMSAQGKQLLTDKLISIWDQSLPILATDLVYVPSSKIKKSKTFTQWGLEVPDHVKAKRENLMPDDIFYLPSGKEVTMFTTMNPRGMRDLSLAAVPASEMMQGPKFSEHMKHAVNELCKELNLDAVLIVMSEVSWSAARIDKHSQEALPEEVKIVLRASTLVPFSSYHQRLEKLGEKRDLPNINVAFRAYESKLQVPVVISVPESEQTFSQIENALLSPMLKTYNDQAHMMQLRIIEDLKKTH